MRSRIEQKFVEISDCRLSYYLGGSSHSKKCLLFLNGLYHGQEAWIKQQRYPYFSQNYRLLFMDYRGVGNSIIKGKEPESLPHKFNFDSIVKDIDIILRHERIKNVTLVGYSVGGMIALWFSYKFNACVESMILMNTSLTVDFRIRKMVEGMVALIDEGCSLYNIFSLVYPWNHTNFYFEKLTDMDKVIRKKYSTYNQDLLCFKLLLKAIIDRPDLSVAVENLYVSTLHVSADEDLIFPLPGQEELASKIKNCVRYMVKGGGHAAFIEHYEEVNQAIEKFLVDTEKQHG